MSKVRANANSLALPARKPGRQVFQACGSAVFSYDEQDADGGILDMISCARSYYVMQVAAEGQADWSQFNAN